MKKFYTIDSYMSCPYKNIFGEPRTGVHRWRVPILDISVVDTALTVLLAFGIFKIFNFKNFWIVMLWTFIVGEIFHWAACTQTRVIKFLGL
jgi:hypothetical protein